MTINKKEKSENKAQSNKQGLYFVFSMIVMILWGSLFPFIKIGYKAFNIKSDNMADIIMFAAFRFLISGFVMCIAALCLRAKIKKPFFKSISKISLIGFFAVYLHYICVYTSLALADGSKVAILKQAGPLIYTCFSFVFIKSEKFNIKNILAAVLGFLGVVAINFGTKTQGFSTADLLVLSASAFNVISMIISQKCSADTSPIWITGISQLFGGVLLFFTGIFLHGKIPQFGFHSRLVFLYICFASVSGYTIFFYVQKKILLSKLFIIKFSEPLFACIFSALLLKENIFRLQYLISFVLIATGLIIAERKEKLIKWKKG